MKKILLSLMGIAILLIFGCINTTVKSSGEEKVVRENMVKKVEKEEKMVNEDAEEKEVYDLQCFYVYSGKEMEGKGVIFIKGDLIRVDVNYSLSNKKENALIIGRDGEYFFKSRSPGCDWISIDYSNELNPEISFEEVMEGKEYREDRGSSVITYKCYKKSLKSDLFKIDGNTCSYEEFIEKIK